MNRIILLALFLVSPWARSGETESAAQKACSCARSGGMPDQQGGCSRIESGGTGSSSQGGGH